jgi:hypothetical protein
MKGGFILEAEYPVLTKFVLIRGITHMLLLIIMNLIGIGYAESALPKVSAEFVINGMEYSESLVRDVHATFMRKITYESCTDTTEFEWTMKGNKHRLRQITENKHKYVETYDGQYLRHFRLSPNRGSIREKFGLGGEKTPDVFGFHVYNIPVGEFLKVYNAKLFPETERIDGHECYVIEAIGPCPHKMPFLSEDVRPEVKVKVWVDPKRGFRPVQLEKGLVEKRIQPVYHKIQLRDFGNGIWFPVEGERVSAGLVTELTVQDIEINQGVSDQLFENPGWNVKTRIFNHMTKEIVGCDDSSLK